MAVYWEAYGLVPGEPVRISIRLEKEEGGWLAGLTRAIGLGGTDERGTVSWTETVEGEGPFRRAVTLEVADLEPGCCTPRPRPAWWRPCWRQRASKPSSPSNRPRSKTSGGKLRMP